LNKNSDWELHGKFDVAVDDDEDIVWHDQEETAVPYILAISSFFKINI